ncbi:MAG: ATP-binding protein [Butyricimonas faecihominis]
MDSCLQDKKYWRESKLLEFKEILPQGDKIAKTVIAFSNTSGGQLVIGVGDDRTIKGIDPDVDIFELQDRVASIIYDLCYPNILPEFYTTNVDGKLLFIIEVYRGICCLTI